ncbi:MAG: signal peptidase I [Christensenellales bacterium]
MNEINEFEDFEPVDPKKKKVKLAISIIAAVIVVALLVTVITFACITESFIVDGASMLPTLNGGVDSDYTDGDKVMINKVKKISRGDIVVAYVSKENKTLIKRVVAVGGDKVKIENGILYVNGVKESGEYLSAENKRMYSGIELLNVDEFVIKENYVYLLGDNRSVSHDSRAIGQIGIDEIKGVVFMIIRENKKLEFI